MKTWKHYTFAAIVAIIGVAFSLTALSLTACDNGNDNTDPKTFTVSFNANGGTPQPSNQTVTEGGKASEPQGVTKGSSSLDGWYKEAILANQWNFTVDTVTADITLYAKWNEPTPCNCQTTYGTTAHLGIDESCTCTATVKPCGCTEQTATIDGTTIIIRKEENISVVQMNTAIDLVQKAYDDYIKGSPVADTNFKSKVTEIQIVSGNTLIRQGGIVKVGIDNELEDVGFYFDDISAGTA